MLFFCMPSLFLVGRGLRRTLRLVPDLVIDCAGEGAEEPADVRRAALFRRTLQSQSCCSLDAAGRPSRDPSATPLAIEADDRYPYVSSMWNDFIRIVMSGSGPSSEKAGRLIQQES